MNIILFGNRKIARAKVKSLGSKWQVLVEYTHLSLDDHRGSDSVE